MNLQFYTLYLGDILNDNFFVNPFSSDFISPILHCVLNRHEEAKLTNRSANELAYLVNQFSSIVTCISFVVNPFHSCFTDSPDNTL